MISLKRQRFSSQLGLEEHGLIKYSKLFGNTFTNDCLNQGMKSAERGNQILLAYGGMRINNWEIVSGNCILSGISNLI